MTLALTSSLLLHALGKVFGMVFAPFASFSNILRYKSPNSFSAFGRLSSKLTLLPCFSRTIRQKNIALALRNLSDEEILLSCSSSPSAEGPGFVDTERR